MKNHIGISLFVITMFWNVANAQTNLSEQQILLREIYKELIEINTTDSEGNTTRAAEAMPKRLRALHILLNVLAKLEPRLI